MRKIVLLAFGLLASIAQAEEITIITITDEAGLRELADRAKTCKDSVIKLENDIVLSAETSWIPIGVSKSFKGTFDGQGHTVSGININTGSKDGLAGLFGFIGTGGIVRNVKVAGNAICSNGDGTHSCYVGAIAGCNYGTISQCVVTSDVTACHTNTCAGGIVGQNASSGRIENCYVVANINDFDADDSTIRLGGIAGVNEGTLCNSWYKGTVANITNAGHNYICDGSATGCFYAGGSTADVTLANSGDNSSTLSENNGLVKSVLLSGRTLYTDDSWNTLCLPFSIAASGEGLSPIAGATVMEMTSASLSGDRLSIRFTAATAIEAGKPYLVKWSDTTIGDLTDPLFFDVTIANKTDEQRTVTCNEVSFKGVFSSFAIGANDQTLRFLSAANTLYYPDASMSIGSCRAYFKFSGAVSARQAVLSFDTDDTTGLPAVTAAERQLDGEEWVNLRGQRLTGRPTVGGIYLHQGKKIMIK